MSDLKYEEVKARVTNAKDQTIGDLLAFGEKLLNDAVDRLAKLDSKATGISGYLGGVITLVISTSSLWMNKAGPLGIAAAIIAVLTLILAAWHAVGTTAPLGIYWFSDNDWLRKECLDDLEQLRRYRILTLWRVISSHQDATRAKSKRLKTVIGAVKLAFFLLLAALLDIAWWSAPLQHLRVWIG